ncbi:MAG: acetolactate decarboxylase, partial [Blautia sp.]|nr:acetolactate decarboxylase [Blautia sp.]
MKNRYLKKALAVMTGISMLAGGTAAIVPAEESVSYEAVSSETSAEAVSGETAETEAAAAETAATETATTETAAETTGAAATEAAAGTTEAAAEAATETAEAAATEGAEAATEQTAAVDTYAAETTDPADHEAVYQVALLQSLAQGYFDGTVSVGELKQFGDTGIGTFDGLDGEMIVLDGTVYRAAADGTVSAVEDDATVPFANITFFEEDGSITIENATDIQVLMGYLNEVVAANGKNLFYMVKVNGTFSDILVRSEPKQEKPYRLLDEALAADQVEYEYTDINGTLVGLFCPVYMKGLNSAGWHFHFISDDLTRGGHVLQVNIASAQASYDITGNFRLFLPDNEDFQGINLGRDMDDVIKNAETQSNGNAGQADAQAAADAPEGAEAEDGNAEAAADIEAEGEGGNAEVTPAEAEGGDAEAADAEAPAEGEVGTDVEGMVGEAEPAG